MRTDADIHYIGVFGRRTCGKTTLIDRVCKGSWKREGRYSVILDPKLHEHAHLWGSHCYVTADRDKWFTKWQHVDCRNCNIVWEETSTTLQRNRKYAEVFTMTAGERGHRLIVSGHSGKSMLPEMREQLTELFLFRQSRSEAEAWAEQFADESLIDLACSLNFERKDFLHIRMGRAPIVFVKGIPRCPSTASKNAG